MNIQKMTQKVVKYSKGHKLFDVVIVASLDNIIWSWLSFHNFGCEFNCSCTFWASFHYFGHIYSYLVHPILINTNTKDTKKKDLKDILKFIIEIMYFRKLRSNKKFIPKFMHAKSQ